MSNERNLPDWLDGFMLLTENSEPPVLFRKWAGVSAISSALMRKVKINLGISLTFYPNFYIVLVGPSATGKGTAMKFAYDILEQVPGIKMTAQATSFQALIKKQQHVNLTDTNIETGKQVYHSSITVFSNEFTVFLGYHNRELMAALCDWYDCPSKWAYDTVGRGQEKIVGCWINIIAGTTPDNIQESIPTAAIGGGLTSRIIFVNETKRDKVVVFHSASEREIELQQRLVHDLEQISLMSGSFSFTESAVAFYSKWCHIAAANPPIQDPKFDGYCGRRRNHLLSLAMVCSASRSNDLALTEDDLIRAADMMNEVENKMSTVFRGIGRSDIASLINDAIIFIENSLTDEVPMHEFARHFEGHMDKFTIDRVLQTLEVANHVVIIRSPGMSAKIKILDHVKNKQSTEVNTDEIKEDVPGMD